MNSRPSVLFACVHNSGRSVAAEVLARHLGGDAVEVRSAGSDPGTAVNPTIAEVLAERGFSVDGHTPAPLTLEAVEGSDIVVTMGCGERCPVLPGKRYEDWAVADPAGEDVETVREIVDDVETRVRELLTGLDVPLRSDS